MGKSTQECRKDCDVFEDWKKMEDSNVGLVLDKTRLEAEFEHLKQDFEHLEVVNRRVEAENRRLKTIVDALIKVKECADAGTALISNQGQALDGYSELANYRAIIEKAK